MDYRAPAAIATTPAEERLALLAIEMSESPEATANKLALALEALELVEQIPSTRGVYLMDATDRKTVVMGACALRSLIGEAL